MAKKPSTKERLIDAALQIIISKGIDGYSIEAICAQAGFSRGAFYSTFGTKDALLAALAEREYRNLISVLRSRVEEWSNPPISDKQQGSRVVIETLLFRALDSVGINRTLYILHSDMLIRCIRDPYWGAKLLELNNQFISELGKLLITILKASGREIVIPIRPLTHAIVGIVIRAAGIEGWHSSLMETPEYQLHQRKKALARKDMADLPDFPLPLDIDPILQNAQKRFGEIFPTEPLPGPKSSDTEREFDPLFSVPSNPRGLAYSPARGIVEIVLLLLYGASKPKDTE